MLDDLDKYATDRLMRYVNVPLRFQPQINVVYPPDNNTEFERWFAQRFTGANTDRVYIGVMWCGFQVNHNYGKDERAMLRLQSFIDTLPTEYKYFTISQFDDGVGVDWKGKDVLVFDMSKRGENHYPLPLIGEQHPYKFDVKKKYFANFIGNLTHPIREHARKLEGKEGFYISFKQHGIMDYCRVIAQSTFTLCYRGYGLNSFRIAEALQYGSIPVYISDEFIEAHNIQIDTYGVKVHESQLPELEQILADVLLEQVLGKHKETDMDKIGFSYEGCYQKIIQHLETGA